MPKFIVNGGKRLCGSIRVHGSKNAILPILAACLLLDGPAVIRSYPKISDFYNMLDILRHTGCSVVESEDELTIDPRTANVWKIPDKQAKEIRSSIFLLGSVIGRFGKAKFTYPGGCEIGNRPIDLHLNGLRKLNITIEEEFGYINCNTDQVIGSDIQLDYPSVGATENIMMAGIKAKGKTIIRNAAREPEIVELQRFLNMAGARVFGAGTDTIIVNGAEKLSGVVYDCQSDRIVAGTYMLAAVMTLGDLTVENCIVKHNMLLINKLREAGVSIDIEDDYTVHVCADKRMKELHLIETAPYPGFPTDMQSQMCAAASIAEGTSIIIENVFDNRFKHLGELTRMGANIMLKNNVAIIKGVNDLYGTEVRAMDLRGAAAMVLAGLAAKGQTVIENIQLLDRGYEHLERVLNSVGADIQRVT
ncbi:MAG: UDP-N-acetylglucosamine 1-carboxyvinyltransferase [Eubacteriales bacterium]